MGVRNQIKSSARAVGALNHRAASPAPSQILISVLNNNYNNNNKNPPYLFATHVTETSVWTQSLLESNCGTVFLDFIMIVYYI